MTHNELLALRPGDVIHHEFFKDTVMVSANYGGRVTAVRTYDVTNPSEWKVVAKVSYDDNKEQHNNG